MCFIHVSGGAEPRLTSGGEAPPHIRRRSPASHPAAKPHLQVASQARHLQSRRGCDYKLGVPKVSPWRMSPVS
jgi:hypothetical protein